MNFFIEYPTYNTNYPTVASHPLEEELCIFLRKNFPAPYYNIFYNTYIPCTPYFNGKIHHTELDVVLLCPKGIIVFECKDWNAEVSFNNDFSLNVHYPNKFYYNNPNSQNDFHKRALLNLCNIPNSSISPISYIRCKNWIPVINQGLIIFHTPYDFSYLYNNIVNKLESSQPLSAAQIDTFYKYLTNGMYLSNELKLEHNRLVSEYINHKNTFKK